MHVVLMGDKLSGLPMHLILQKEQSENKDKISFGLWYNFIAIPLAAGILFPKYGILLSIIAALLMATSSIAVVINALSLK